MAYYSALPISRARSPPLTSQADGRAEFAINPKIERPGQSAGRLQSFVELVTPSGTTRMAQCKERYQRRFPHQFISGRKSPPNKHLRIRPQRIAWKRLDTSSGRFARCSSCSPRPASPTLPIPRLLPSAAVQLLSATRSALLGIATVRTQPWLAPRRLSRLEFSAITLRESRRKAPHFG